MATGEHSELDKTLWRSLAWVGGARWGIQLFTWASTLIVARLLAPSDYGIVGLASLFIGIVMLVADSGLGSAVVTLRSLTRLEIAQLNLLSGLIGTGLLLLSSALAWPVGKFFDSPQLPPVIVLMTVSIAIVGWQSVPDALLQNQVRFRALAFRDTVRGLTTAAATIALALLGLGYWALAGGVVIGAVCGLGVTIWLQRVPMAFPSVRLLAEPISFSAYVLGSRLAWYGYSNADFFVAGKVLSTSLVGSYALAWTLANVSVDKVSALVGNVTPSFFSAAQHDRELLCRYFGTLTRAIALVSFPVSAGLALVASDFIPAVLGEQWIPAVAPLIPLSLYAGFRSVTPLLSTIFRVTGDQRFVVQNAVGGLLFMPVVFYIGSYWGPVGIAYGWVFGYPLLVIPQYRKVFQRLPLDWRTYAGWLQPALVSTIVMAVGVTTVKWLLPYSISVWIRLAICISTGVPAYVGTLVAVFPQTLGEMRTSIRGGTDPEPVDAS